MTNRGEAAESIHSEPILGDRDFRHERARWRSDLAADDGLRSRAVDLQRAAEEHHYTYTWDWLGVPVIRVPDDIVVLQDLIWQYRPERIVETGVARGGGLILDASLQLLAGLPPRVLGVDISILEHTRRALDNHPQRGGIELLETDSTSAACAERVSEFLTGASRVLLILDSNHTEQHVLAELELLAPLLPGGSVILVADTLIEELPADHYRNRPWGVGNNPATAIRTFLASHSGYVVDVEWSRRGLLTEFRDGVLRKAL